MAEKSVMPSLSLLLLSLALFPQSSLAAPKSSIATEQIQGEYQDFLTRMGFKDYSAEIAANRKQKTGIAPTSDAVLAAAQERYTIFNSSRDLAVELVAGLAQHPEDKILREKLVDFTAQMLKLRPALIDQPVPPEIQSITNDERKEKKLFEFAAKEESQIMKKHTAAVAAGALDVLGFDAKNIEKLDRLQKEGKTLTAAQAAKAAQIETVTENVAKVVSFTYLDAEMGQTEYLGRAMALALTKVARDTRDPTLEKELRNAVRKQDLHLENFVGDKLMMPNEAGKPVRIPVRNGAIILERSDGPEAARLIAASRPPWSRLLDAIRLRLRGHWIALVLEPGDTVSTEAPSLVTRIRRVLGATPFATRGYSHVGMANVLKDPATGISTIWALDNYPHDNGKAGGGIRVIGVEQFAQPGPYVRLGVKNMEPKAVLAQAKNQAFNEEIWQTYELEPEGFGEDLRPLKNAAKKPAAWKTKVTPEEFARIKNVPMSRAKTWFEKTMQQATEYMRGPMLTAHGIGFNDSYGNVKGWAFCSQTVQMAIGQSTGIEIQPVHDRWDGLVRVLDAFHSKATAPLGVSDPRTRTVAPGGLVWGTPDGDFHQVTYPDMDPLDRAKAHFSPMYAPKQPGAQAIQAVFEEKGIAIPIPRATGKGEMVWDRVDGRGASEALDETVLMRVYRTQAENSQLMSAESSGRTISCARMFLFNAK